jgi:hypothetical protein
MTLVWSPGYAPVDEYYDSVSLLLYGNGTNGSTTITDNSPSPKTVTAVGNAQISTAQSKFGGASMAFVGAAGDRITAPGSSELALGGANFTLEAWLYPTAFPTLYAAIFDFRNVAGFQTTTPLFWVGTDGKINFQNTLTSAIALSTNVWTHIAFVRSGSTITAFVGGQASGTVSDGTTFICNSFTCGAVNDDPLGYYYRGYIDDLRITKVARYTSNFTPPTASFPDLSPTGRLTVAYTIDSDAAAYIAAVEAADGQALETATRTAIDSFVKGCKNDGIWNAIKASCILAGARTLAGALVPLVGTAPTNNGFIGIGTDYVRKTGLVGDGSTKYLNSNRNNNTDPQNSFHLSVYASSASQIAANNLIGARLPADNESARAIFLAATPAVTSSANFNGVITVASAFSTGFVGVRRATSTSATLRFAAINTDSTLTSTSVAANSLNISVFARRTGASTLDIYSNARIAFYSIGESLDLALLDTRVTSLINAFAAAIP